MMIARERRSVNRWLVAPGIFLILVGCLGFSFLGSDENSHGGDEQGWKVYFGNLHAHSGVSDGVESPKVAYEWARDEAKLDFLCLSEHNHIMGDYDFSVLVSASQTTTSTKFVALIGQEFSTIKGGNHVNLYDVAERIPKDMNSNYRGLFSQWLPDYRQRNPQRIVLGQFNHPASIENDYGIKRIGGFVNYDGNWSDFINDLDPWVSLIAIITGPSDSDKEKDFVPPKGVHRDVDGKMLRIWQRYLDKGFHLSPVADQDNHRKSWGTRTTARTAVLIKGAYNKESLLKALQAGNCYATEDKNLKVWFSIDGAVMGSRLSGSENKTLAISVRIEDEDESNSRYTIHLYRDEVGDDELPELIESSDVVKTGDRWETSYEYGGGNHELFFVHVDQEESRDDAWTAPIWLDPAFVTDSEHTQPAPATEGQFVSSKNSSVYHYSNCKVVQQIKPENRQVSSNSPQGKRLHQNCPIE